MSSAALLAARGAAEDGNQAAAVAALKSARSESFGARDLAGLKEVLALAETLQVLSPGGGLDTFVAAVRQNIRAVELSAQPEPPQAVEAPSTTGAAASGLDEARRAHPHTHTRPSLRLVIPTVVLYAYAVAVVLRVLTDAWGVQGVVRGMGLAIPALAWVTASVVIVRRWRAGRLRRWRVLRAWSFAGVVPLVLCCIILGLGAAASEQAGGTSADEAPSVGFDSGDFEPAWSPDGRAVVYSSNRGFDGEIVVVGADGRGPLALTDNNDEDAEPAWSPDGSSIVFSSDRTGLWKWRLYVIGLDGSGLRPLTEGPGSDAEPAWSPDGSTIAFTRYGDVGADIYVATVDGLKITRLTSAPALEGMPAWSPDGSRIAFVRGEEENAEIYVMNADGSAPTRLTKNVAFDGFPSWSPDGAWIAFDSGRDGDQRHEEIYVMRADGGDVRRLTYRLADDYSPSWSPDGKKIVFSSNRSGEYELYVIDPDGTDPRQLARPEAPS